MDKLFSVIIFLVLVPFILIAISFLLFNQIYCKNSVVGRGLFGGNPVQNQDLVDKKYTLISPYSEKSDTGVVYLLDLYGKPLHTWRTKYPTYYSILKPNGNLVVSSVPKQPQNPSIGANKNGRVIQELDWKGNVLWEYQNENMHHDFDVLPNGNVAAIVFDTLPDELEAKVKGGTPVGKREMISDAIIEVDKSKSVVWEWRLYEHLNLEEEELGPLTPRDELGHSNSVKFLSSNPIDGTPAYLLSVRHLNVIFIIRKSDGKIIWRSAKDTFAYQHDATLLDNGHILVFDNNKFRENDRDVTQGSRILEIDPKTKQVVWSFEGGQGGSEKSKFKADIVSGAQRLSNGNTLIINGTLGYLFEVTPEKKIVWDYMSPYSVESKTSAWPVNFLFKARRYGDEIAWPEKLPSPMPSLSQSCYTFWGWLGIK